MPDTTPAPRRNWQADLDLDFAPSPYQVAIFEWVLSGRGHAVVEAVAGSGKTSTIVASAKLIAGSGLFVAFNGVIAERLGELLKDTAMASRTVHSHGWAACRHANRRIRLDKASKKYKDMIRGAERAIERSGKLMGERLTAAQREAIAEDGFPFVIISKLVNLARLSLVDMDGEAKAFDAELLALARRHELTDHAECLDPIVCRVVQQCLLRGAADIDRADFTDMVWLPVVNGWTPRRYQWLFVDECQDISAAARALLMRSVAPGGRMLWVGDRRQAIYGFAGADAESFQSIIDECEATVLPLSVCYRCPTSALAVARDYCPQIEAREGAPVGEILDLERDAYVDAAKEGDLVLCRRNAPLLALCFELIAEGVPAIVRGRDIGAGLVRIVKKISKCYPRLGDFGDGLETWEVGEAASAQRRYTDKDALAARIDQLADKANCIRVIWSRSDANDYPGLCAAIQALFSDERGSVMLSSVHRAKGLEADRVGILEPARLVSSRATQPWQLEQEANLCYVAYTRTKSTTILIS